jgi:hypothetical protein
MGQPLSTEDKACLSARIAQEENEIADYRTFKYQPPTLMFDHALSTPDRTLGLATEPFSQCAN